VDLAAIYLLKTLILPPMANIVAIAAAVVLRRRLPRTARALFGVAFGSLLVLAVPKISDELARPLERFAPFDHAHGAQGATAIVVLGGGRYSEAPEYGNRDTVHPRTLTRLRYGAFLAARLGLPVAVIGGDASGGQQISEGMLMYEVMQETFRTPVQWVETGSRNTAENALFARQLIRESKIILVTNALHMRRSRMMFEQAGFEVVVAPIDFTTYPPAEFSIFDYVPSLGGLTRSHAALHEYLGIYWYRWRYRGLNANTAVEYKVDSAPPKAPQ
jgi:uncharacterized SAM-binding protein YcdF (DUF218 family)